MPSAFVLLPSEVQQRAHRGEKDGRVSFWLQPAEYDQEPFREAWERIGHGGVWLRFDRLVFTTDSTALCPRQHQIAALRRALDDNDRAAFDRTAREGACKVVGPDIRLAVVSRPGAYDPDVEVRVAADAPADLDGGALPRGKVWALKSMVRN